MPETETIAVLVDRDGTFYLRTLPEAIATSVLIDYPPAGLRVDAIARPNEKPASQAVAVKKRVWTFRGYWLGIPAMAIEREVDLTKPMPLGADGEPDQGDIFAE